MNIEPIKPSDDGFKESSDAIKEHIFQSFGVPKPPLMEPKFQAYTHSIAHESLAQAITEKWLADQKRKAEEWLAQELENRCIRCLGPSPHRSPLFGFRGLCFDCAMALS
jgi:hypothetical protein